MKNIIKIALIVCFVFIFTTACGKKKEETYTNTLEKIRQQDKIVVGVRFDARPFGYLDSNNNLQGFDIDIAREIAQYLLGDKNKVEFKQVTTPTRILTLASGQVDMIIATMTITPKRMEIVEFSNPYYVAGQAVMIEKSTNIRNMKDLNNKKVALVLGSTGEQNLRVYAPEAIIQGYKTYVDAVNSVKNKRADALVTDDTIILGFLSSSPELKILPKRYTQEPYGIAFRKGPESLELKKAVNYVIQDLQAKGKLNKIKAKWIEY